MNETIEDAPAIVAFLERVEHLLSSEGWTKGAMRDDQGQRCLEGAITKLSATDLRSARLVRVRLSKAIYRTGRAGKKDTIVDFNDHPNTVFGDVLDILNEAKS